MSLVHERDPVAAAPAPLLQRIVVLIVVVTPFAALIGVTIFTWGFGVDWLYLALLGVMYCLTGLGITIGFHRLFTHKSFSTFRPIEALFAILGSMATEGPILNWVGSHRRHHQHSDDHDDPHSPNHWGGGVFGTLRGLWHAHMGWIFEKGFREKDGDRYLVDFKNNRLIQAVHHLFPLWVALGLLIPGVIAGAVYQTWTAFGLGVVWGGLVRIFFVHHVTWSINSVCHIWGSQPFDSHDESRNNAIFGILAFGEGWHNNHHAFPTSARHGLAWWQLDTSWIIIWTMAKLRLAWDVRVPPSHRIEAKKRAG